MAQNYLAQITHNRNFKKQSKHVEKTTAPKPKKVRYDKTVQIASHAYNRLKWYSFKNNIHMAAIVTDAVNSYLDHHKN